MTRITAKTLRKQINRINIHNNKHEVKDESGNITGFDKGYIELYGAYGAWAINEISTQGGTGCRRLFGLDSAKACGNYLDGLERGM